jgi:hypothetical protein
VRELENEIEQAVVLAGDEQAAMPAARAEEPTTIAVGAG